MRERRHRLREPRFFNRRVVRREKPTKWWSDPLRWIPLVISAIALTISYLGWRESHKGRLINEEINRPVLMMVSSGVKSYAYRHPEKGGIVFSIDATLKNTGKSKASSIRSWFGRIKLSPESDECKQISAPEETLLYAQSNEDVLPGIEQLLRGHPLVSNGCAEMKEIRFHFFVALYYKDELSGREYDQSFHGSITVSPAELLKR